MVVVLQIAMTVIGAFLSVVLTKFLIQNGKAIAENGRAIAENGKAIAENGRAIAENAKAIAELTRMMDERTAIIAKAIEESTAKLAELIVSEGERTRGTER